MSMNHLLRGFILAGILIVHFVCAFSQQQPEVSAKPALSPEKRAMIAELLEVLEAKKSTLEMFNAVLDQDEKQMPDFVWQGVMNTKEGQELSAESKEELRTKLLADSGRMRKRTRELFLERIDLARIVEDLSYDLYDKYFTEPEIKDLITFYKSPTGKKTIEVMPKMFTESMANTMEAIKPKAMEIVTQLVYEEAERVRKELLIKISKPPVKPNPPKRRGKP